MTYTRNSHYHTTYTIQILQGYFAVFCVAMPIITLNVSTCFIKVLSFFLIDYIDE